MATDDAGPADDTFTLRLTAVMLVTEIRLSGRGNFANGNSDFDVAAGATRDGPCRCV